MDDEPKKISDALATLSGLTANAKAAALRTATAAQHALLASSAGGKAS